MLIEIKCRFTGKILYSGDHDSIKIALEFAVKAHANLAHANLDHANLAGAYLAGAYLAGANLAGANLAGAYLAHANMAGAYLAHANLAGANLAGAKGDISNSHELLAQFALRFDVSLKAVAAMIAGRLVGCWRDYTDTIRAVFGEATMRRLWQAWSQDESWGVVAKMRQYDWPEPTPSAEPPPAK